MGSALAYRFGRLHAELRGLRTGLEQRVAERTAELQLLNEQVQAINLELHEKRGLAEEASRAKSQFLATMSHELRSPLNSIIGFSEVLLAGRLPADDPRREHFQRNILASGEHLLALINDILDLSKIESGRMEPDLQAVDLPETFGSLCALCQGIAEGRQVTLRQELRPPLPALHADPSMVKQMLWNLLSNAIKFSPDGGVVTLSARGLDAGGSPLGRPAVELAVEDRGIGIDASDHQRIFEEFQQVDASISRRFGGTGLGLALVRRMARLHDGVVTVDSALGRGSTFRVYLPAG
jgi:signal transduction histidine kinase